MFNLRGCRGAEVQNRAAWYVTFVGGARMSSKRLWRVDPLLALVLAAGAFMLVLGAVAGVGSAGGDHVPLWALAGGYVGGAVAGLLVITALKYLDGHLAVLEREAWESLGRPPGVG